MKGAALAHGSSWNVGGRGGVSGSQSEVTHTRIVRGKPEVPAVEGQFKEVVTNADGGAIPWETWWDTIAPDDINALKAQDAGARSKFQTPSARPDGRSNVEVNTFDGQALDRARVRSANARMLVLCSGGGG